jgi:endogenous inhibitor of DNA gyrase (YacG/DUF329 family)
MMGNRLYVSDAEGHDYGGPTRSAVVHTSLKEAKKWLWNDPDVNAYCDGEYINLRVYWLREVDVSDLNVGDDLIGVIGIERGVYSWVDATCPRCGKLGQISQNDDWDMICCSRCDDALTEEWIQKVDKLASDSQYRTTMLNTQKERDEYERKV